MGYDVNFLPVEVRPFEVDGRALPGIADAVQFAATLEDETVFIVNSDILFSSDVEYLKSVENMIGENDLVFANRIDINSLKSKSGDLYPYGYDVFAFHSSRGGDLDLRGFNFGSPWWDYWMPMDAMFSGMNLKWLRSEHFFHLTHDQAWDWSSWNFGFALFIQKIQSRVNQSGRIVTTGDFGAGFSNFLLMDVLSDLQKGISSNAAAPHELGMEMSRYIRGVLSGHSSAIQ